ncbi:MAG TPA: DNA-binding protein [Candidatus Omnitrophica bacterium]|nr:DNA-binding protein [Candidatus Omnitrophota bacterium]
MSNLFSIEIITSRIFVIRGKKVMLDRDLALLYEVTTKRLNEQVKRNMKRFPGDFMFQLTKAEKDELVAICGRFNTMKHSTVLPYAFTEQGVAMLSGVLNSDRAIMVNIQIMRAFTQLRRMLLTNKDLRHKIEEMERKYDKQFAMVFQVIKQLLEPQPVKPKPLIGFHPNR